MTWISAVAIYFIMWWVVLFAVLPFGVKSVHEGPGEIQAGHDPGSPLRPLMLRKIVATTIISTVIFFAFVWLINSGLIGLDAFPPY